jgi:hypothetical protein
VNEETLKFGIETIDKTENAKEDQWFSEYQLFHVFFGEKLSISFKL